MQWKASYITALVIYRTEGRNWVAFTRRMVNLFSLRLAEILEINYHCLLPS